MIGITWPFDPPLMLEDITSWLEVTFEVEVVSMVAIPCFTVQIMIGTNLALIPYRIIKRKTPFYIYTIGRNRLEFIEKHGNRSAIDSPQFQ